MTDQAKLTRILVADDEPALRELFRDILAQEAEGGSSQRMQELESILFGGQDDAPAPPQAYRLTLCAQGREAVDAVRRALAEGDPFALAFLDVRMPPGIDGIATAEMIRALDPDIQIVMVTAFSDANVEEIVRRVPPADKLLYQRKPFHPQEIVQFARSLCSKWQAEQENRASQDRLKSIVEERTFDLAEANRMLLAEMRQREQTADLIIGAKREWEATFDSVSDLILHFDEHERIRRANMAAARQIGQHPRNIVGMPLDDYFGPEDAAALRRFLPKALEAGRGAEFELKRLGGHFLINASILLQDAAGRPLTVLVVHDISEHKRLEAQLRHSQKMEALGTLAGGIAHDFNNILGIIMGFSELMSAQAEAGTSQARRLSQILDACGRARDLVAQIMTFSRGGDMLMRPLSLKGLITEIMKLIRASLASNIDIDLRLNAARDVILGEKTQIEQILVNLCGNAGHAMRQGSGLLCVHLDEVVLDGPKAEALGCQTPGEHLRLRVQDNGQGMDAETLERVFDPFFTTKKPGEGTGMGLAVVHGVVRRHGGCIHVESRPGSGSTFEVFLPRFDSLSSETATQEAVASPSVPGRVVLVDDERGLVEIGVELLRSAGCEVLGFSSAQEALRAIREAPGICDALVTDYAMPGMTGIQLALEARRIVPELAVVLVSGFSEQISAEQLREAGVTQTLIKPVSAAQLAQAVEAAIRARKG